MATRIYPKLSKRNFDAETLSEIQSRRSQRDADLLRKTNSRKSIIGLPFSPSIKNTQNESQSFWRDFGPLEVTTCVASDGKQSGNDIDGEYCGVCKSYKPALCWSEEVVLVFLEGRVCLNGEPIRVLPNGKIISSNGRTDSMQQHYFDIAMKVRNERKAHPESQEKTGLGAINPSQDLHDTVSELNSSVAKMAERHINRYTTKSLRLYFQRKQRGGRLKILYSDLTSLVSLLNTLNGQAQTVSENFEDVHEKLHENECALLALIKTVKCFSTEAILSEPGKYTNAVYREMYEKFNDVAAREKDLISELRELRSRNETLIVDKNSIERKLADMTSRYDKQFQEVKALRQKNRILSLNHTNSISQTLDLESQSSILEVQLEQLQTKSKNDQRFTKDTVEKLRYLQKRLQKVTLENEKLKTENRKSNDQMQKLSLRSRQQSKSIGTLQEERLRVEHDRDRLIQVVRGALQDRHTMTSRTKAKESRRDLQKKFKSDLNPFNRKGSSDKNVKI